MRQSAAVSCVGCALADWTESPAAAPWSAMPPRRLVNVNIAESRTGAGSLKVRTRYSARGVGFTVEELPVRLACVRCGAPYVAGIRGRTRRYCGTHCRRDVEFEVRRVRRRLGRAQHELARRLELDRANRGLLSTLRGLDGRSWLDDVATLRAEIAALHRRLHVLRTLHPRAAASGRKEIDR